LQAQPAPGDSEVSRGAWVFSAVTVATVAGAGYQMAVAMCRSRGIGLYLSPTGARGAWLLLDGEKTQAGPPWLGVPRRDC
jgi:hypothetical protein